MTTAHPLHVLPHFLSDFESFLFGLFRQFLTGGFFQRLDELLLVLENADAVLLFGRREFLAHVPDDISGSLARGDAVQDGAFGAVWLQVGVERQCRVGERYWRMARATSSILKRRNWL